MSLPHAVAGSRRPSLLITWYEDGTSTAENLTGATLTGKMQRVDVTAASANITGTLTVTDAEAGEFRWDFSAADVLTAGQYRVQFTATFLTGQSPAKTFQTQWVVDPSLS